MQPFKLNWDEMTVELGQGRYKHFIRKPSRETLVARDIPKIEVPVSKNGKVTKEVNYNFDERDAELCLSHKTREPEGYSVAVPEKHLANAFRGIFNCVFRLSENSDILAESFVIEQVFGDEDEPDAIIEHHFRQPEKKQFDSMYKAIENGHFELGKNGKKIYVVTSFIEKAETFYGEHLVKQAGCYLERKSENEDIVRVEFSAETRQEFLNETMILFKSTAVEVAIGEIYKASQD